MKTESNEIVSVKMPRWSCDHPHTEENVFRYTNHGRPYAMCLTCKKEQRHRYNAHKKAHAQRQVQRRYTQPKPQDIPQDIRDRLRGLGADILVAVNGPDPHTARNVIYHALVIAYSLRRKKGDI